MDADVLIIGGGAAGLFCAFTAAQRGRRVVLLEHANKVGKKILMSGGGRCNFTNTGTTAANFLSQNPHFCRSALARFAPEAFIELVDRHGIAWHEKDPGQLFCDESSKLIVRMLLDECAAGGAQIHTGCQIQRIDHQGDAFALRTSLGPMKAARLVVATGGLSIPSMGASGFGYEIARQFGHGIVATRAGLVPLTLSGRPLEAWQDLSGLSLPLVEAGCEGTTFAGALLLTHRGLSGPAILQISSYWQPGAPLDLDLLPGQDAFEVLKARQRERPAAELRTVLGEWLPARFAQRFCEQVASSRPMRTYRLEDLRGIAAHLRRWPIVPSGTEGYRTAEVTLGGVATDEVSSSTLESRRVPGLHFIGEVLDVTGWLGGYNFQWAWASAHACGSAV